jgi:hypothetical protein
MGLLLHPELPPVLRKSVELSDKEKSAIEVDWSRKLDRLVADQEGKLRVRPGGSALKGGERREASGFAASGYCGATAAALSVAAAGPSFTRVHCSPQVLPRNARRPLCLCHFPAGRVYVSLMKMSSGALRFLPRFRSHHALWAKCTHLVVPLALWRPTGSRT